MARLLAGLGLAALLAACNALRPIPFDLQPNVTQTLASWHRAGFDCDGPHLGWPGPAADWGCRTIRAGVEVHAGLIADRWGVQSMGMSVASSVDRETAARAFAEVAGLTPTIDQPQGPVSQWLLATNGADGSMPAPLPAQLARVSIDSSDPRYVTLYITPSSSSMLCAGACPT